MSASEPVVLASDQSAIPVTVASIPSHAVTNAGTFAVQNTAATPAGTNNIGDVDVLTLPAIPAGTNNIGDVDVLTINGVAPAFGTGLRSASTQRVTIATDDSLPVTNAGTFAVQSTNQANSGVDIGDVTINNAAGASAVNIQDGGNSITVDGTFWQATQPVSLASVPSHAVTNAGTFAVQVDGSALTSLQLLDDTVFADDAAFTLSTSKGSVIEGVAVATDGTDPTAVIEGDAAALRTSLDRILLVNQTHPRGTTVSADYASAQTNTSVIAAPGASLSIYITDIQLSNGATAGNVTLLDGSGGTVKWEAYPAINGGAVLNLRQPIKLTANTALCITSTTVTTHSIFIGYYIAA